jgi:hypothetical protein
MCSSSSSFFFSLVYSIHTAIPLALAFVYASPSHKTKLTLIVLGEHCKYTLSLYSLRFGECSVSLAVDPQETLPSAYPPITPKLLGSCLLRPGKSRITLTQFLSITQPYLSAQPPP